MVARLRPRTLVFALLRRPALQPDCLERMEFDSFMHLRNGLADIGLQPLETSSNVTILTPQRRRVPLEPNHHTDHEASRNETNAPCGLLHCPAGRGDRRSGSGARR